MESSSWAEYKYVEIFQLGFVVVESQEDEKYALLSQGSCILQFSHADAGLIFGNCGAITITMLIHVWWVNYKSKKGTFLTVLGEKNEWMNLNEFIKHL